MRSKYMVRTEVSGRLVAGALAPLETQHAHKRQEIGYLGTAQPTILAREQRLTNPELTNSHRQSPRSCLFDVIEIIPIPQCRRAIALKCRNAR